MKVLHFKYLWGACREAEIVLEKYPQDNLFEKIKNDFSGIVFLLFNFFKLKI
ncbi:hypothetical protein CCUN_1013 [Campylobacter cuniculorum DSM 23162 = LMG 24588]|uniref:Uncharacterized protein n=1 Tax=Campylobacter cuniculorum DSM 23162 = LMG 24588 TaxID=1121267 RepID=A0A1W6BX10_9BACT|nr:hypothetical protein CCUN_1013 [Campylobacter cuniculorum DSM 23162 = LMG 24588]